MIYKKFEDFINHYGSVEESDYSEESIKKLLDLRGIEYSKLEHIGSGNNGDAFDIGGGKVLKITSQQSEIYYAKILMDIASEYLIKIYDVFYHEQIEYGYKWKIGFIIEEKLNELSSNNHNYFNRFLDSFYVYGYKDAYSFLDEEIIEKFKGYINSITKECEKYDLPTDDLRGNNIGYRDNSDVPVFFDIADIYKSKKYDINIDILQ